MVKHVTSQEWCEARQFKDGDLVNVHKIVAFLREEVIPTGNTRSKQGFQPLGQESIKMYIKALVDLYVFASEYAGQPPSPPPLEQHRPPRIDR
jgi:hypothetical protein